MRTPFKHIIKLLSQIHFWTIFISFETILNFDDYKHEPKTLKPNLLYVSTDISRIYFIFELKRCVK